jgi:hypothetical protein
MKDAGDPIRDLEIWGIRDLEIYRFTDLEI